MINIGILNLPLITNPDLYPFHERGSLFPPKSGAWITTSVGAIENPWGRGNQPDGGFALVNLPRQVTAIPQPYTRPEGVGERRSGKMGR